MRQSRTPVAISRGFSLIEVLVGMVLGLIAIVIMYQVFAVFEGQRRTTVSGGDAQSSGHLSMYSIERNVRLAGLGLVYLHKPGPDEYESQLTCAGGIRTFSQSAGGLGWAQGPDWPAVPVRITDGGAGAPDSFTSSFSRSGLGGTAAKVTPNAFEKTSFNKGVYVKNAPWLNATSNPPVNAIFKEDDIILVAQPNKGKRCVRLRISEVKKDGDYAVLVTDPNKGGKKFDENPGPSDVDAFLPPDGFAPEDSIVTHAGPQFAIDTYSVNASQQLVVNGTPTAEGVVSLQVQYGIGPAPVAEPAPPGVCGTMGKDPACQTVVLWTDAKPNAGVDWGNLTVNNALTIDNIKRIKAVRIAIVTRSQLLERDVLYGAGRAIEPKAACGAAGDVVDAGGLRLCAWRDPAGGVNVPLVDLTGTPDWDRYRYRVYETIVPLRNVLWGTKST